MFGSGSQQRVEFDPLGADIGLAAPQPPDTGGGEGDIGSRHIGGIMDARWADFFNLDGGCVLDGLTTSCGLAMSALNSGAASEAMRASYYNLTTHQFDYAGYVYADPVFGFAMVDFMGHGAMAQASTTARLTPKGRRRSCAACRCGRRRRGASRGRSGRRSGRPSWPRSPTSAPSPADGPRGSRPPPFRAGQRAAGFRRSLKTFSSFATFGWITMRQ